ncbi:hypothetical protein [Roseateles saccharophilus]|uniref:Putative secreted protein with PEP-CTERM sorting signal n=1 Tax=Roseateles saccharophilus TaxID=304 RepID=A0A4R3UR97_ROSSA|nr:hypothetical protein [Roseateles saccharophilus]MDG0833226.1 hypothetical protein [Roseateles saccharophilus]TCU94425.1 putative secreted protein with PEP-CTERM sorting signal [Roseateles saccharophilus]
MRRTFWAAAAAIGFGMTMGPVASANVVLTYAFIGKGDYSVDGGFIITHNVAFFGDVTLNIDPSHQPAPTGTYALAMTNWDMPTFNIHVGVPGGASTLLPAARHLTGETEFDNETVVEDNYLGSTTDRAFTRFHSEARTSRPEGVYDQVSSATFDRYTTQPWLGGFGFQDALGLAPGGSNHILFQDTTVYPYSISCPTCTPWRETGTFGDITLSSLTLQAPAAGPTLPEPGSMALVAAALAGLGAGKRFSGRARTDS